MNILDLDLVSAALERERAEWAERLTQLVTRKVGDAHAHAQKAVTDVLRRTPDGKPTLRRAQRSPSFAAALARLEELHTALAGPGPSSLRGAIRDARSAFYRRAFALHEPLIPTSLLITPDPEPTLRNIALVRGMPLHGYDIYRELEGPIQAAQRMLAAAVALAGNRAASGRIVIDLLGAWETRAGSAITQCVLTLLSDSVEYCENQARADLIHPEFRASAD